MKLCGFEAGLDHPLFLIAGPCVIESLELAIEKARPGNRLFDICGTVERHVTGSGYTVVRDVCLQCPTWTAIAQVPEAHLRPVLRQLDGDDVDAIVQVGTNLSMVRLAAAAEVWLGKPVIAINAATYWHALRANGIADRMPGLGRLLAEF